MDKIILKTVEGMFLTDDVFFAFCQANSNLRLERDHLTNIIIMPPTGGMTGHFNTETITDVNIWNRKNQAGKVFDSSTGFTLPTGAIRSPDVSWIPQARWEALTDEERTKFLPLCPNFVIEIRSPSDRLEDLQEKCQRDWIGNGSQLVWLIDPSQETAYVYRADGSIQIVYSFDEELSGERVLEGFKLPLSIYKTN